MAAPRAEDPDAACLLTAKVSGLTYLFCSDGCRSEFLTDPPRFLRKRFNDFPGSPRTL